MEIFRQQALDQLNQFFPQGNWHAATVRRDGRGFVLTTHCHLPGDMSIESAHAIAEDAELHLRTNFPQFHRVTIHTEPEVQ
jgi:divalent metal cation (Fe/Co/Zn/Cd) transporter